MNTYLPQSALALLGTSSGKRRLGIVSCGKAKLSQASEASALYTSPLFRKSHAIASATCDRVLILSAKHGLIESNDVIEPYDVSANELDPCNLVLWEQAISRLLKPMIPQFDELLLFAGSKYRMTVESVTHGQLKMSDPMAGMGLGKRMQFLKRVERIFTRIDTAKSLYETMALAAARGNRLPLGEYLASKSLPARGLYIFSDASEPSEIAPGQPRIVRIGTHAVSEGSSSSLRGRLRTHLGTGSGGGSHRSSIFRLHVGNSFLQSIPREDAPHWGKGMAASKVIRLEEEWLERQVSGYMKNLLVTVIPISDEPSRKSFRSLLEAALIGLFTEDKLTIEAPSSDWIGRKSVKGDIRDTGLWNLQHSGRITDISAIRLGLQKLAYYVPEQR